MSVQLPGDPLDNAVTWAREAAQRNGLELTGDGVLIAAAILDVGEKLFEIKEAVAGGQHSDTGIRDLLADLAEALVPGKTSGPTERVEHEGFRVSLTPFELRLWRAGYERAANDGQPPLPHWGGLNRVLAYRGERDIPAHSDRYNALADAMRDWVAKQDERATYGAP